MRRYWYEQDRYEIWEETDMKKIQVDHIHIWDMKTCIYEENTDIGSKNELWKFTDMKKIRMWDMRWEKVFGIEQIYEKQQY